MCKKTPLSKPSASDKNTATKYQNNIKKEDNRKTTIATTSINKRNETITTKPTKNHRLLGGFCL